MNFTFLFLFFYATKAGKYVSNNFELISEYYLSKAQYSDTSGTENRKRYFVKFLEIICNHVLGILIISILVLQYFRNFFLLTDGDIISTDEASKIVEVDTTATLKWNLNGVLNEREIYSILYNKDNKEITILSVITISSNTLNVKLDYSSNNNPFEENRLKGNVNLNNGNGTVIVEISKIQYDESGVFTLEIFKTEKLNATIDVQGNLPEIKVKKVKTLE